MSIEKVVDDENGYWCELTLEPAKKPTPEKVKKEKRSPLKEKVDNTFVERCKSAETKRKSMLGEKSEKAALQVKKAIEISGKIKMEKENKRQAIVKDLDTKMKKHEKLLEANLNNKKVLHAKKTKLIQKGKAKITEQEAQEQLKIDQEIRAKLALAEKKRNSLLEQTKIKNAEKSQKFQENKDKNIALAAEMEKKAKC